MVRDTILILKQGKRPTEDLKKKQTNFTGRYQYRDTWSWICTPRSDNGMIKLNISLVKPWTTPPASGPSQATMGLRGGQGKSVMIEAYSVGRHV